METAEQQTAFRQFKPLIDKALTGRALKQVAEIPHEAGVETFETRSNIGITSEGDPVRIAEVSGLNDQRPWGNVILEKYESTPTETKPGVLRRYIISRSGYVTVHFDGVVIDPNSETGTSFVDLAKDQMPARSINPVSEAYHLLSSTQWKLEPEI